MTLYELSGEYAHLVEVLEMEGADVDETVGIFDQLEEDIKVKAEGYGKIRANFKGEIEALKAEEKRLQEKRKHLEKAVERLENGLFEAMQKTGMERIETPLFKFSIQRAGQAPVIITAPDAVPPEYLNVTVKPDLGAIRDYIKETGDVSFAELGEQKEILRIR